MKRSRRTSRRSLSSNQWTLLLLFLIIVALAVMIAMSWLNRPAATPPAPTPAANLPTTTPEPTSTPRPTAVLPTRAAPTPLPSLTPAVFSPAFTVSDCRFTIPGAASITCGVVPVPEDRQIYPGRTVRLAVAIYHSADTASQEPILYLDDSPIGSAIQWTAKNYRTFVQPLTRNRDLIVFDLRGSGLSVPNLDCPEIQAVQKLDQRQGLAGDQRLDAYSGALETCRDRLTSHGIDITKYTTRTIAQDTLDIIQALGLESVNLFAASHGTRPAQMLLGENPQEIRLAVLDSPLPLDENLPALAAANYDQTLANFFTHCASDPVCNSTYPNLEATFDWLVEELNEEPVPLTISGELGIPDEEVSLDGKSLTRAVTSSLNSSFFISSLPRILTGFSNASRETSLEFVRSALALPGQSLFNLASGMRLTADCQEMLSAASPQALEDAQAAHPRTSDLGMDAILGDASLLLSLCEQWGAANGQTEEVGSIQTGIPVLVLAGQFDALFPPGLSRQVADDLGGSSFIEVPGVGHTPTFQPRSSCPVDLVLSFLEAPGQPLDTGCLDRMAVSYYTTYTGEPPLELTTAVIEDSGLETLLPVGWTSNGQGIFRRDAFFGDFTELQVLTSTESASDWLDSLTAGFDGQGFDRTPARNTTRFANRLNWTLYRAFSEDRPVDLALAEAGEQTLLVLLLSQASERDALYRTAFLPAIEATYPVSP